jgi:metal-sulfur cluster biosynthetic enzyme
MINTTGNVDAIVEALKDIYDPEIPFNIVDLGLVYEVKNQDGHVDIKATLTTPGCGMGPYIVQHIQQKVAEVEGIKSVEVDIVWDPPWTPDRISSEIKQQLGIE